MALDELNIPLPNRRTAAITYAVGIAEEIINEEREIISGLSEMYQKAIKSYDFFSESQNYAFDSIFFEHLYGLYNEHDDVECAMIPGDINDADLLIKIKEQLLIELRNWIQKYLAQPNLFT